VLPGHDPDGTSAGFPTPMLICGDAEGSSQGQDRAHLVAADGHTSRVGLPSVTWTKIPATRPGIRCGFTAMFTA
jgi:hypothetical protein